ncbi:chemotaxis protein CheW [Alicyclobacillus sp. SO9]|uniref:chemotaxis protein CheW n=1 Tax=Alicyclobacillus sp. SO9 TaxID=2665646 RepID=UPI0018E79B8E|nr:chemotaxis protein CheW [Alicyclobacillus sp. SO9]QQE77799.1 chemotaxis protein CheW [Alicyclobacillus sp. SO9]
MKYVVFMMGTERYALPVDEVQSIEEVPTIRPVPQAPEHVVGVTNLRGSLITVLSLHSILRVPEAARTSETRVLVTHSGAYIVDSAQDVIEIADNEIDAWEGSDPRVRGVWSRGSDLILILDTVEQTQNSTSA